MEEKIKNKEEIVEKKISIRVPENNEQELAIQTDNSEFEIDKLEEKMSIKIRFAENIDEKLGEDKFYPIVESTLTGTQMRYRFRDIGNVAPDLMGQGHKVNKHIFKELISLMTGDTESDINTENLLLKYSAGKFHKAIGWDSYQGDIVFKYTDAVTKQDVLGSRYEGNLPLESKGSLQGYMDGVKRLIVPYPALTIVYLVGASGIITQNLNLHDSNIILNICGESSSGKTTAENVALSFWGNPQELSTSFNSTANRIEQHMAERKIMPVLIDDMLAGNTYSTKRIQQKVINDQIFRYATGKLKGRMGSQEDRYYGATITSSETSLFEKLNGSETDGQFYRMIELKVNKGDLTQSVTHAKEIERLLRWNYGLGAFEFGKYLIQNNYIDNALQEMHYDWENELLNDSRLVGKERIAKRLAIILLTGDLMNKCFGLDINLKSIHELLIDTVTETFEIADEKVLAYQRIKQLVDNNSDWFAQSRELYNRNEHVGVCTTNIYGHKELYVETSRMEALLKEVPKEQILENESQKVKVKQPRNGEVEAVLRYWREHNWLYCCSSNQRLYRKLKMGDKKEALVYSIILD